MGSDTVSAGHRALAILNLRVTRQAVVLSYNHLFQLTAVLFVVVLPLAWLLKSNPKVSGATPAVIPPAPPRPMPRRQPVPVPEDEEAGELVGAGAH